MEKVQKFGTAPVFFTAISTILGAIMFLRFGYAVGHTGFAGTLLIILLGHLVTVPTAMAIAEIATNQRVEGGGEYFIISRSFGLIIGGAIGISLFMSQAISVAFYIIAFAQAFDPVFEWVNTTWGLGLHDKRIITIPATIGLGVLIVTKGAELGLKALYGIVAILFVSIIMFFFGHAIPGAEGDVSNLLATVEEPHSLIVVFAICFPAFTGMTAGVGLSGDLRDPRKSIPFGTLAATLSGMLIYVLIAYKLATSASPEALAGDQLIMSRIALWGPIIPLGLAAATLSSAVGSNLVAPRTLQALAQDDLLPWGGISKWLGKGVGPRHEPVNAAIVTAVIALVFAALGDVDFVAQVISMFFMVTYGSICMISFLEHFAADPSYRPTFRSRWYISLFGALICVWLMFQMSVLYASLAILFMLGLYLVISSHNPDKRGLSSIAQGVIFQLSRRLQVFLQKSAKQEEAGWRPAIVSLSDATFSRLGLFDMLRWMSHRYGFGTYIHFEQGYLSRQTNDEAGSIQTRMVDIANISDSNVYVDTIVSPSFTTAISQIVQLPGISGHDNNMVLLEFDKRTLDGAHQIVDNFQLISSTGFDVVVLGSSDRGFGYKHHIHVWLTPADFENASLMILIAYILIGHPEWRHGEIRIFSTLPAQKIDAEKERLVNLIRAGRLPIAENNVILIPQQPGVTRRALVSEHSRDADLIILGFRGKAIKREREELFKGYEEVGNVLFVNTSTELELVESEAEHLDESIPTPK
ncbi:MAG: amino acid permease [Acidobacteria bacterium]|nr:amino acid permease [Acidobacteriota bacterium]